MKLFYKRLVSFLIFALFYQISFPTISYALSSGPSQPEYSGFSQLGISDLVDHSTGDFNYSLPLLELPGNGGSIPISLGYNGVTSQEQEASSVGLGWNLNIGNINRDVIGYPDDFDKEEVIYRNDRKDNTSIAVRGGQYIELIGIGSEDNGPSSPGDPSLSVGNSVAVTWNSYQGVGFTVGPSINAGSGPFSGSVGLNRSTIDGYSVNTNLSLRNIDDNKRQHQQIGLSFSSHALGNTLNFNSSGIFNHFHSADTPDLNFPRDLNYTGLSIGTSIAGGAEIYYTNVNLFTSINSSNETLANKNRSVPKLASGVFYHDNIDFNTDEEVDMDYRREGDFPLYETTRQLQNPIVNKDRFSINTPFFNDHFCIDYSNFQTLRKASSIAAIAGVETGGQGDVGNLMNVGGDFSGDVLVSYNNPTFFQDFGNRAYKHQRDETTSFKPLKYWLLDSNNGINDGNDEMHVEGILNVPFKENVNFLSSSIFNEMDFQSSNGRKTFEDIESERRDENSLREFVNQDIINNNGSLIHPFLGVKYTEAFGGKPSKSIERDFGDKKISAFLYNKGNGMKFYFGLPVLNLVKEEIVFGTNESGEYSCNRIEVDPSEIEDKNSNSYLNIVKTPSYAESFLLTTVVGPDYVDHDNTDGLPNINDQGFWANYEYCKTNGRENPYLWRFPFSGANVQEGISGDARDNTASFVCGEREQFYISKIKTATHEVVFDYSVRSDNHGAADKYQNSNSFGAKSYQIDKITLKEAGKGRILKTVHLNYRSDGLLCGGAENASTGKLTLETVAFTNFDSSLGLSYPYTFDYYDSSYQINVTKDRWGFNKTSCSPFDFSAESYDLLPIWHLKKITMPSGSSVDIALSRDHYSSVETLAPGKMFRINSIDYEANRVYIKGQFTEDNLDSYFQGLYQEQGKKQIYFKLQSDVLNNNIYESVDGYAFVSSYGMSSGGEAYIEFEEMEFQTKSDKYHPFLVMTWHKLKGQFRNLMYSGIFLDGSFQELMDKLSLIFDKTKSHYQTCINQMYGSDIDYQNSYIRLSEGTGYKKGGDVKVDRIIYSEVGTSNPYYGFQYEYTMKENDRMISSGNCPTEPLLGSFANSDKYGVEIIKTALFASNQERLFQELPINKNHLLSTKVKYQKVTVKSLASSLMENKFKGENVNLNDYGINENKQLDSLNLSATGKTEYTFYTSRDFPSINKMGGVEKKSGLNLIIWLALFSITPIHHAFSQGYYSENNNMHGKLKEERRYGQAKTGEILSLPLYTKSITYQSKPISLSWGDQTFAAKKLDNFIEEGEVGGLYYNTDYNTAVDLRYSNTNHSSFGVGVNFDISSSPPVPFPFITAWPSMSIRSEILGTAVVSHNCYKKGIVASIVVSENNTEIETVHDSYNHYTGQPQQIIIENEFEQFNASMTNKAYDKYPLMGPSSTNHHFYADISTSSFSETGGNCGTNYKINTLQYNMLVPGDYISINSLDDFGDKIPSKLTFGRVLNKVNNEIFLQIDDFGILESSTNARIENVISGYSNQLNQNVKHRTVVKTNVKDQVCDLISESTTLYGGGWNTNAGNSTPSTSSIKYENNYIPIYQYLKDGERNLQLDNTNITSSNLSRSGNIGTTILTNVGAINDTYLATSSGAISPVINKLSESSIPLEIVDRNFVYQTNLVSTLNMQNQSQFQGINASATNSSYYETAFESFESIHDPGGTHFSYSIGSFKMMKSTHIVRLVGNSYLLNERFENFSNSFPETAIFYGTDGTDRVETFVSVNSISPFLDPVSGDKLVLVNLSSDACPLLQSGENLQLHLFYGQEANDVTSARLNANFAHTGTSSLLLPANIQLRQSNLMLLEDKEYFISLWKKDENEDAAISLKVGVNTINLEPTGGLINGWQKMEAVFEGDLNIFLESNSQVYIDDIRIHAYNGSMQSYVYNQNQQLEYILDENNYFSKYHYDKEGRLVGISKETERGIRTISEQRQFTQK